jgi:hypothetical protein
VWHTTDMPLPKRKKVLTRTLRVRVKPATFKTLVACAKACQAETVSDFVREALEVMTSGDTQKAADFVRQLAGGLGHQLVLDLAQNGGKGRK